MGSCFFVLTVVCLIISHIILNRKIDAHVCKSCLNETDPNQVLCVSPQDVSPIMCQVTRTKGDSGSSSDDSDSCEETTIPQIKKMKTKTSLTYSTIQFNTKGQCADYENLSSDYVNVNPTEKRNYYRNVKDAKRLGGSVDYTNVIPAAATFRLPSHPKLISKESTSS